jgi:hypothetical protein
MLPVVFSLLAGDSDVASIVGTKIYRHGQAPQKVNGVPLAPPYVTWFVASGAPANELDGTPRVDNYTVQIDCWSDSDVEVEQLAEAVRNAIEPSHHMTAVGLNGRDPDSMRYRISLTFTFWTPR